jgi:prephenate dehydrogenase
MPALGIAGTGLIGASIGLRAKRNGARVYGYDVSERALRDAMACGAVDESVALDDLYVRCETVVLAMPPAAIRRELRRLAGMESRWELLLDVASVKAPIVEAARRVMRFVATHPLAGNERSGPSGADESMFEGRTWAYVPSGDDVLDARFHAFAAAMGAEPFACDADRHDRVVAVTSHLPQLVAQMLGERIRAVDPDYERFCGPAGREILRLSTSPGELWAEIMRENGTAIAREAELLASELRLARMKLSEP